MNILEDIDEKIRIARDNAHNAPRSLPGCYGNAYARWAAEYFRLLELKKEMENKLKKEMENR